MKKLIAILLIGVMLISAAACGNQKPVDQNGNNDAAGSAGEQEPEEKIYKVGETASGELFEFKLISADYVDMIEKGREFGTSAGGYWHSEYKDVKPGDGYKILKVVFSVSYKGKTTMKLPLDVTLNYDNGYEFTISSAGVPKNSSGVNFVEKNRFNLVKQIDIGDPMTFSGETVTYYYFVNDVVAENPDKPFVLITKLPVDTDITETETFTFDLR